jgi:membrane glycosyltransferase
MDHAVRDRRWAQGNLQHTLIVPSAGLSWVSRLHLIQGIMSYLASPLWFAFILAGLALSLQAQFVTPEYFPDGWSLFPIWPVFDPELAFQVFGITMLVLFLPKILGVVAAIADRRMRQGCGGTLNILKSAMVESLFSALIAPVMMLIQTRFVADILLGRDSGWSAQNRADQAVPWRTTAARHLGHTIMGVALGTAAAAVSTETLLWLSPIVAGLLLSAPISWLTAQRWAGIAAQRRGLFVIPEETWERPIGRPVVETTPVLQAAE